MNIFISVVSHGHGNLIKNIDCLPDLARDFNVIVKCNIKSDICELYDYAKQNNLHLLSKSLNLGFGDNNNYNFQYSVDELGLSGDDYFIVLNPDVHITSEAILKLTNEMCEGNISFAAINLYKDHGKTMFDYSIRRFPSLLNFISSYFFKNNNTIYDKSNIHTNKKIDWAAGSFLAFKASHYQRLGGFSDDYFMYCEDIDICYRSHLLDVPVVYFPGIKATHYAKHANRSIFSKHFIWHVTSIVKFLIFKNKNKLVV